MSRIPHPPLFAIHPKQSLRWSAWLACILWLTATGAFAATFTSNGTSNFADPANWTPFGIPGPGDHAFIQANHTVTATADVAVDILEVLNDGQLVMDGTALQIQVDVLFNHDGGTISGAAISGAAGPYGSSVYISRRTSTLTLINDGVIQGGYPGGYVIVHDGGGGGDLACPNGSAILSNGGSFLGGDGGAGAGNVYLLAATVGFVDTTVLGGTGAVPAGIYGYGAGNVYITGVTVALDGLTKVRSGSNTASTGLGGTVKIVGQSCNSAAGSVYIGPDVKVKVGVPSNGTCPGALVYAAVSSTILGQVAAGPTGCAYWDPPNLELVGDAELTGGTILIAGSDFDASGLASRTIATPAIDAADTLEINLTPGGVFDLQGLQPGFVYFRAGQRIQLCVDPAEILTDRGVSLADLMEPPPTMCPPKEVLLLGMDPNQQEEVATGQSLDVPVQVINLSNVPVTVNVFIEDYEGWLSGGSQSIPANLAPGEAVVRTVTIDVPATAKPGSSTTLKVGGVITGQPMQYSFSVFTVVDAGRK